MELIMRYGYMKNGKRVWITLPKRNHTIPKSKRMRKKRLWALCGDCRHFFKTYEKSNGTRADGEKVCHSCLMIRVQAYLKRKEEE
ncbi:hypothetical protein CPT_Mater45 [Bacillus phage Mater]|uniref:Uncharacterized protein n=1 Tax=Bacillus phage Mater TaxID=1540090 RepID=A0A0A0RML0_9CAUD|nr:hypothetical protein CPT_Mater45 [Bacillus phage Mater]AIW03202.1 hypothetical protein CPT_Mater45 [Bacillus phage Mater]